MNLSHLHLMLNHIPVLGTAFGMGLFLFGTWRRSEELRRTALGFFVLVALFAIPVFFTGEPAEDMVKSLPGFSEPILDQHENAATLAFGGVITLGVIALTGLLVFRSGRPLPVWYGIAAFSTSVIVSGLMAWTANVGGKIRHTEVRSEVSLEMSPHQKGSK